MSILDYLSKEISKIEDAEVIQGTTPKAVAEHVDLSIAYSPVVAGIVNMDLVQRGDVPMPIKPRKDGLRYFASDPSTQTWNWYTPERMKVMRARFLLLRGHLYAHLGGYSHTNQQRIIAWYFEGGVWRPEPDSPLGKALGIVV